MESNARKVDVNHCREILSNFLLQVPVAMELWTNGKSATTEIRDLETDALQTAPWRDCGRASKVTTAMERVSVLWKDLISASRILIAAIELSLTIGLRRTYS